MEATSRCRLTRQSRLEERQPGRPPPPPSSPTVRLSLPRGLHPPSGEGETTTLGTALSFVSFLSLSFFLSHPFLDLRCSPYGMESVALCGEGRGKKISKGSALFLFVFCRSDFSSSNALFSLSLFSLLYLLRPFSRQITQPLIPVSRFLKASRRDRKLNGARIRRTI